MKLGVSYNLFDGEELLEFSIKSIRNCVDYINVVYQDISNYGQKNEVDLFELLNDFKFKGLIDEFYLYKPDLRKKSNKNELKKRNIGLNLAKKQKCSHFLTMDTDEFYEEKEFLKSKEIIISEKFDGSACSIANYVKIPIYKLEDLGDYYVPFIFKINFFSKFSRRNKLPVITDPTRKLKTKNFKLFTQDELIMHHMTFVRKDLSKKINNSSAKSAFPEGIIEKINQLQPGDYFPNSSKGESKIVLVNNKFDISIN